MIKYINLTIFIFLLVFLFSSCTRSQGIDEINNTTILAGVFNLTKDVFNYENNFGSDGFIVLDNELYTNSEQMNICNLGEKDIIVYLYNKEDLNEEILQIELPKFESKLVTNLTSSKTYKIGIKCQGEVNIKITD